MATDFQPRYSPEQTQQNIGAYQRNPYAFQPDFIEDLEKHAEAYHLPFARDAEEYEFSLGRGIKQAAEGFFEGFSTLPVGKESANEYERVMRAVGHLAGFAGIVPLSKPLNVIGKLTKSTRVLNLAKGLKAQGMDKLSVPMLAADAVSKRIANPIARGALKKTFGKRSEVTSDIGKLLYDPKVQDIASSAFHLGIASTVSSWRGGIDQAMQSFMGGAQMGAAFGVIGNVIGAGGTQGDQILKGLSGSLYQGLSSEHAGQTTPEKVYEYLLGGYFGYKALPANVKLRKEFIVKAFKEGEFRKPEPLAENVEGFLELPEDVQKDVSKEFDKIAGSSIQSLTMLGEVADLLEKEGHDYSVEAPEGFKIAGVEGTDVLVTPEKTTGKKKYEVPIISKIISGGQTGADMLGLKVGRELGIETGGTAPPGWMQQPGGRSTRFPNKKEMQSLGMVEGEADKSIWRKRTKKNVADADGTIIFGDITSPGSKLTLDTANKMNKPAISNPTAKELSKWIKDNKIVTLNVAGNRQIDTKRIRPILIEGIKGAGSQEVSTTRNESAIQELESRTGTESTSDSDIGTSIEPKSIALRAVSFAENNLRNAFDLLGVEKGPSARLQYKYEVSDKINSKISELTDKKTQINHSEDFIKWFEKEYKTTVTDHEKGVARQWLTERNSGKQVQFLSVNIVDGKPIISNLSKTNPYTETGKLKFVIQPETLFEKVYKELTVSEENPSGSKEPAYVVLDHIIDTYDGKIKEHDLYRYKDALYYRMKSSKLSPSDAEAREAANDTFNEKMASIIKNQWEKGYYFFGGRGDAERAYFAKVHPWVKSLKDTNSLDSVYRKVASLLEKDAHKKDIEMFLKSYMGSAFGERKHMAFEAYKEMFLSNVLYDMNNNALIKAENKSPEYLESKEFLKELSDSVNKTLNKDNHFIKGPIAFNKRQQIWTTTGYNGSNEFIKERVKDLDNGHYKYILVEELDKLTDLDSNILDYVEKTDGAIVVRDDVIKAMNKDFGMPESGQNKSFIVAPNSENGTMLGKYMLHSAGEQQSKAMEKEGLHFYVYDSAAKQRGTRNMTTLDYKNNKLIYDKNLTYSDISPEHVKGNFSEKNTGHMTQNQRIPKQLLTNLTKLAFSTIGNKSGQKRAQAIIDNMFDTIMGEEYHGADVANKVLKKYFEAPTESGLQEVLRNIDSIGLQKLIEAMKMPGFEKLNHEIYKHILKVNDSLLEEAVAEGEITKRDKETFTQELREFNSSVDRLIRISDEIVAEDSASSSAVLMHKWVRDYRMQAVRNFVVNRLAKPKISNSASVRMRPLDAHLYRFLKNGKGDFNASFAKKFLSSTEEADRYFFLDGAYKDLMIETTLEPKGKIRLEDFWRKHENGDYKNNLEEASEVLRAISVRVPMDSISGSQVLEFAGFTDRAGHGGLFHPRVMRALGGADLDGDKAFIFFGGRNEDGTGGGMKKTWKDFYHANRNEFVAYRNTKTGVVISPIKYKKLTKAQQRAYKKTVSDNKDMVIQFGQHKGKTYREVLTLSEVDGEVNDKTMQDNLKSKAWYYSPYWRPKISENASAGRGMLGPAVINRSVISSAHASLVDKTGKPIEAEYFIKGQGGFKIRPRTDAESQELLREMGRATVAFGSDPLDELGLNKNAFMNEMFKTAFEVEFMPQKAKGTVIRDIDEITDMVDSTSWMTHKDSPIGKIKGINSAFYGRNWGLNRRYFMDEIKELGGKYLSLTDENGKENINTFLPRLAKYLHPIDWSDSLFRRLDRDNLIKLYKSYDEITKGESRLSKALQRLGVSVKIDYKKDNTIPFILGRKLWVTDERTALSRLSNVHWKRLVNKNSALSKSEGLDITVWDRNEERFVKKHIPIEEFKENQRLEYLEKIVKQAEDFIINDLTDMTSLLLIRKNAKGIDEERIGLMHRFSEDIKKISYMQAYNRRNLEIPEEPISESEIAERQLIDDVRSRMGMPPIVEGKISALADQAQIDAKIKQFRQDANLTAQENRLLNQLILSSFSRGDIKAINKIQESKNLTPEEKVMLENLKKEALNTRMSKLGLSSREIGDNSIKDFFREYSKLFDSSSRVATKEDIANVLNEVKESTSENRNELLEKEDVVDIQEPPLNSGLEGLIKGNSSALTPEQGRVLASLKEHLTHYHDSVGSRLNELTRGVLNKDLNAMNFEDYKALDRMFNMLRNGRWGKDMKDAPVIKKMYYYLFPKAVDQEMMKHNFDLFREKGQFMMADGEMHEGTMAKPTQQIGKQQKWIEFGNERSIYASQRAQDELSKELLFIEQLPEHRELHELAVRERELGFDKVIEDKLIRGDIDKITASIMTDMYNNAYKKATKKYNARELERKTYTISVADKDGKTVQKTVTGREVIDRINEVYTNQAIKMQSWIKGLDGGWRKSLEPYIRGWHHRNDERPEEDMPIIDVQSFAKHVTNDYRKGVDVPMKYGMDGLRKISYSLMVQTAESSRLKDSDMIKNLRRFKVRETGFLDPEHYWPHMMFDQKLAGKALEKAVKSVLENGELTEAEKTKELQRLQMHHKSLTGEWVEADITDWKVFDGAMQEMAKKKRGEHFDFYDKNLKSGNMFERSTSIEGWSPDRPVYDAYIKNLSNTYYRQLSQIVSRQSLNEFDLQHRKKWGDKLTDAWVDYIKLYAQDAMGYPSVIPNEVLKNPDMNLNGTLYAKWADNVVVERMNSIGRKLGLLKKNENLPEEMQGVDLQKLRHLSNLEAKYEMATLLAHPKSMFNNVYGGQVHTIQSAGMRNWLRGRDIAWLKANINPGKDRLGNEWNSRADIEKWVESHGIIPELMSYEFGLNPELQKGNFKKFFNEAADAIKENPGLGDGKVREIASKYNITDAMFNKAGWFMRVSERMLRRDAFMAHLVEAHQKFNGAMNMDHPYLIELAKKGVKATQFMYSAPFRPAFARTALGKVMTRFQLWSWNSVRFRGDVIDKAAIYGYRQGTPEFERFKRLIQWDMMSIALGNVFLYSLFDQGLPAPYNWLQDTADWMFGDEKERDRAFFGAWPKGVAPLQLITPPIARLPLSTFQGWVNDDWSSLLDYTIYTMSPFGRMLRDVSPWNPNNIINNPIRTVDALTGIPQLKLHRLITKEHEVPYARGWK